MRPGIAHSSFLPESFLSFGSSNYAAKNEMPGPTGRAFRLIGGQGPLMSGTNSVSFAQENGNI